MAVEERNGSDASESINVSGTFDFILRGLGGNDTLQAGSNNDTLLGGTGDDLMGDGPGADSLAGEDGNDSIFASSGMNTIDGGAGLDLVSYAGVPLPAAIDLALGSAFIDLTDLDVLRNVEVVGGTGLADTIGGDGGANVLNGAEGADILHGRDGDDSLVSGSGPDFLDGGDGRDLAVYIGASGPVLIDLAAGRVTGTEDDTLVSIEVAGGSIFNDTILGGPGDDLLGGLDGDDVLAGGEGADTLDGGEGDDTVIGGPGANLIAGGSGIDVLTHFDDPGPARINFLLPGEIPSPDNSTFFNGFEIFIGSPFNDTMFGLEDPDRINGAGGDDRIDGNAGDDVLIGGSGADAIEGSAGADIASYAEAPDGVILALLLGFGFTGDAAGDTLGGIEGVEGSGFADLIAGSEAGDALAGLGGDDRLFGLAGGDLILGGSGDDVVIGDAGDDVLGGDAGDDLLIGGAGADLLEGGPGNDRIECDAGDLSVRGGDGSDAFDMLVLDHSAAGWDIDLGRDDDQNVGQAGPAIAGFRAVDALGSPVPVGIQGGARDGLGNVIFGSGFADSIRGSDAADILLGGANAAPDFVTSGLIDATADHLDAGAGNDSVYSDAGLDVITLGAGRDLIVIGNIATSAARVSDFVAADDTIGLPASVGMTPAAALAALQPTSEGTALILPTGGHLELIGIAPAGLTLDDFAVLPL